MVQATIEALHVESRQPITDLDLKSLKVQSFFPIHTDLLRRAKTIETTVDALLPFEQKVSAFFARIEQIIERLEMEISSKERELRQTKYRLSCKRVLSEESDPVQEREISSLQTELARCTGLMSDFTCLIKDARSTLNWIIAKAEELRARN